MCDKGFGSMAKLNRHNNRKTCCISGCRKNDDGKISCGNCKLEIAPSERLSTIVKCQNTSCLQAFHFGCVGYDSLPPEGSVWTCDRCSGSSTTKTKFLASTNGQKTTLSSCGQCGDTITSSQQAAKEIVSCDGGCKKRFHIGCVGLQFLPSTAWNCASCYYKKSGDMKGDIIGTCVICNTGIDITEENEVVICDGCDGDCHFECAGITEVPEVSFELLVSE